VKSNPYTSLFIEIKIKHITYQIITKENRHPKKKQSIGMNEFHINEYFANSDNWNFPQQIHYSTNQSQFVELSNVYLSNEFDSNTCNLPPPSTIIHNLQLPENSSSTLRLKELIIEKNIV